MYFYCQIDVQHVLLGGMDTMGYRHLDRGIAFASTIALSVVGLVTTASPASAAGIDGFDPQYLISDSAMYGDVADSLSQDQIQDFLNQRGASCVQGADGSPCLKNATFDTQTLPANQYCEREFLGEQADTAARVIHKAAQACRISPKVLLVLLQKEQGLVTTNNPTQRNYSRATGFRCPDSAPCDPNQAGFATQVYAAVSRLQQYRMEPERFNFAVGRSTAPGYHPNTSCGSVTITPKTAATAALYNYTPYVANAAALANPYGEGDACSSYGNRNFFRIHSDWFGQPNVEKVVDSKDTPPAAQPDSRAQTPSVSAAPATSPRPATPTSTLPTIESKPVTTSSSLSGAFPVGNWNEQALADIARVETDGSLMLFSHDSDTSYAGARRIGQGWTKMSKVLGGADFDGDGHVDILAVNQRHEMLLYTGTGKGFGAVRKAGQGWGIFGSLLMVQRGPGQKPAIIASNASGTWVYSTNGQGSWTERQSGAVPSLNGTIASPDITGTGYSALIVREDARTLAVYSTNNGLQFQKSGTIATDYDINQILNASQHKAGRVGIDVLTSQGTVVTIVINAAGDPALPTIPAQAARPTLWPAVRHNANVVVGQGWPRQHVYSMGDFDGDGSNDAAIMRSSGELILYPAYAKGTKFKSPRKIGTGWASLQDFHTGVDFDGDTRPDIVARIKTGELRLYPGDGRGGFAAPRRIGIGWKSFDSIKVLRQGPGGHPVIIAVSGQTIRMYPTNGRGVFLAPLSASPGYPWLNAAVASDDWNNDGKSDLIYKSNDGVLSVALQTGQGFNQPSTTNIGYGWSAFSGLIPAYFDGYSKALWAVDASGKLKMYEWLNPSGKQL